MEDIYYVDRPAIPATEQVVIHLHSLLEHSVEVDSGAINDNYFAEAVEVKDQNGCIVGTLLYFAGISHASLISPQAASIVDSQDEACMTKEPSFGLSDDYLRDHVDGEIGSYKGINLSKQDRDDIDQEVLDTVDAIHQDRLLNLELELSAAKQVVQDIEDEIADEEGALD